MMELLEIGKQVLLDHTATLAGSLIYVDDGAAEALASNCGLEFMMGEAF
jgi:hypothetical protein